MTTPIGVWLGLVGCSALAVVLAVVLAVQVLRHDRDLSWPRRIVAAVVTPWAAIESVRHRRYLAAALFALVAVAYGVLQLVAHTEGLS